MSVTASVGGEGDASSYGGARLSDRVLQRSLRRLPVPGHFQGDGVGDGLAAAKVRINVAATAERAIWLFDERVLIHRA